MIQTRDKELSGDKYRVFACAESDVHDNPKSGQVAITIEDLMYRDNMIRYDRGKGEVHTNKISVVLRQGIVGLRTMAVAFNHVSAALNEFLSMAEAAAIETPKQPPIAEPVVREGKETWFIIKLREPGPIEDYPATVLVYRGKMPYVPQAGEYIIFTKINKLTDKMAITEQVYSTAWSVADNRLYVYFEPVTITGDPKPLIDKYLACGFEKVEEEK